MGTIAARDCQRLLDLVRSRYWQLECSLQLAGRATALCAAASLQDADLQPGLTPKPPADICTVFEISG